MTLPACFASPASHTLAGSRKDYLMQSTLRSTAALAAFGLSALTALSAPAARAQTQDLFVSNRGNDTISRSAGTGPGAFSTTATVLTAPGLSGPEGLAFDARGDLFAVNNGGSIVEFAPGAAPGTFGAGVVVETGLSGPTLLAFGPSVPAAVPEASTAASLGLLVLGGLVVAARRRKAGGRKAGA